MINLSVFEWCILIISYFYDLLIIVIFWCIRWNNKDNRKGPCDDTLIHIALNANKTTKFWGFAAMNNVNSVPFAVVNNHAEIVARPMRSAPSGSSRSWQKEYKINWIFNKNSFKICSGRSKILLNICNKLERNCYNIKNSKKIWANFTNLFITSLKPIT